MKQYDIRDFGALGDCIKVNTSEIQRAIDECEKNGGERVFISGGNYEICTFV